MTDVGLPGMDGDVLAVQVGLRFDLTAICISGNLLTENRERLTAAGIQFLQKPFRADQLAALLVSPSYAR